LAGIGARRALISDWLADASARVSILRYEAQKLIKAQNFARYIDFESTGGQPLDAANMRAMKPSLSRYDGEEHTEANTASLDPEWQRRIREDVAQGAARRQQMEAS